MKRKIDLLKPYYRTKDGKQTIYHGDCNKILFLLEPGSVDLVITSPPYNASQEYEEDITPTIFLNRLIYANKGIYRMLRNGGRYALNVPFDMQSKSFGNMNILPLAFQSLGKLQLKELIAWDQLNSENDTAWGSWKSAASPHMRHQMEYIVLAYKGGWHHGKGESDITGDEFSRWTLDKWVMNTARRENHPAPFPLELPRRVLRMFSFVGEMILDPFLGSGTTLMACKKFNRRGIGIEIVEKYCEIAAMNLDAIHYADTHEGYEKKGLFF